jgi:phage gp46-like protein
MGLKLAYIGEGEFDYQTSDDGSRLVTDDGLETAVTISLFTDCAATADELIEYGFAADQNRGWWGDDYPDVEGDVMGSRLWLLERSKRNEETLAAAIEYAQAALAWLIDDGVAKTVTATAAWSHHILRLSIEIVRKDGKRWAAVWNATSGELLEAA